MVTIVEICGDPHYTFYTDPMKLFLEMSMRVRVDCGGQEVGRMCV